MKESLDQVYSLLKLQAPRCHQVLSRVYEQSTKIPAISHYMLSKEGRKPRHDACQQLLLRVEEQAL